MYYLATPMYRTDVKHSEKDEKKLRRNTEITTVLVNNGITVFLPQRDTDSAIPASQKVTQELEAIAKCDAMIVILSDTRGTYLEAGYAKAIDKKLFCLHVEETRELSEWEHEFFDKTYNTTEELVNALKGSTSFSSSA